MLCLTCHQPRCENLPHLHYRTFSATLTNTRTMCPIPPPLDTHSPNPSSPLEHERGGHKAGSSKQSPARPAPGEGGQAPPAAGQVSPFPFMSFFFPPSPPVPLFLLSLPFQLLHSTSLPSPLYPSSSTLPVPLTRMSTHAAPLIRSA